jgi:hypothetical protein
MMETNEHLLTECNITEAVWDEVVQYLHVQQSLILFNKGSISDWLQAAATAGSKKVQCESSGAIFLFWWHIWKERNAHIFHHQESSFLHVAAQIKVPAREFARVFPVS